MAGSIRLNARSLCGTTRMKSICFFVGALNAGGAERVLVWVAENLAREGADVTIVTLDDGKSDQLTVGPNIQRISLGLKGSHGLVNKPVANIRRVLRLRQVIKALNPDTLVAFMPQESIIAIMAGYGMKSRIVISERNAPWHRNQPWPWGFLRRRLYRFSDVQVAQTRDIGNWLQTVAGCRGVSIIPNAVQLNLVSNLPDLSPEDVVDTCRPLVLAIGTKPDQKGFDLLIEAFGLISAAFPDWQLVILGLGPDSAEGSLSTSDLHELSVRHGIQGRIFIRDRISNVEDWYQLSDIFVLSSRFEGFPNVLIEAMSRGCAVVAFDCDTGPGDIINDGTNGYLVPAGEFVELSIAMSRLMSDKNLRDQFSVAARGIVDDFCPNKVMALWYEVLGFKALASSTVQHRAISPKSKTSTS